MFDKNRENSFLFQEKSFIWQKTGQILHCSRIIIGNTYLEDVWFPPVYLQIYRRQLVVYHPLSQYSLNKYKCSFANCKLSVITFSYLQWGSKHQTSRVLKSPEPVQLSNGHFSNTIWIPDPKHLNTRLKMSEYQQKNMTSPVNGLR